MWIAHKKEPVDVWNDLPEVVYVHFPRGRGQFRGLEHGVYPITPGSAMRYLDRKRKKTTPLLNVWRRQLPLLPEFALTAHQAQGQALEEGAIVALARQEKQSLDCVHYRYTSPAISAHLRRRAFPAGQQQFSQVPPRPLARRAHRLNLGKLLQSEEVQRVQNGQTQERFQRGTNKTTPRRGCLQRLHANVSGTRTPTRCSRCRHWQASECLPGKVANVHSWARTCSMCAAKRQCWACGPWLLERCFKKNVWKQSKDRICNACKRCKNSRCLRATAKRWWKNYAEKVRKRRAALDACRAEIQAMRKEFVQAVRSKLQRRRDERSCRSLRCLPKARSSVRWRGLVYIQMPAARNATPSCSPILNIRDFCIDARNTLESRTDDKKLACGHQFSVQDGEIAQMPAWIYAYQWPRCNAAVQSNKRDGRIDTGS